MREIVYQVATSLDGYIADPNGSYERFSMEGDHAEAHLASFADFDAVVLGLATYQIGLDVGITLPYPGLEHHVVSTTLAASPDPAVQLHRDGVELARRLRDEAGKPVYLCGGAKLATSLAEAGLVDRLVLKVQPFLLGAGIPFLYPTRRRLELTLTDVRTFESGVVFQSYRVG